MKVWVDARTRLPVRQDLIVDGDTRSILWTYEDAVHERDDYPSDFFSVADPDNPALTKLVQFRGPEELGTISEAETRRAFASSAAMFAAAFAAGVLPAAAGAHVIDLNGMWLFTGETYNARTTVPDHDGHRVDPMSVIWMGPTGSVSLNSVQNHTTAHWRDRRIVGGPPGATMNRRNGPGISRFCRDRQYIWMRRQGRGENDGAWSGSTAYMSTNGLCTNQYHIRMWSSKVHADLNGSNHTNEWVLAPIHHEHVYKKCIARHPIFRYCIAWIPAHRIDLDWDVARLIYYNVMREAHCGTRDWDMHPDSQNVRYGPIRKPYSGIISQILLQHVGSCP